MALALAGGVSDRQATMPKSFGSSLARRSQDVSLAPAMSTTPQEIARAFSSGTCDGSESHKDHSAFNDGRLSQHLTSLSGPNRAVDGSARSFRA
jgi:hypothetical protein